VLESLKGFDQGAITRLFENRNLEDGLSRLRRIRALLEQDNKLLGFDVNGAESLDAAISEAIIRAVDIKTANVESFVRLGSWAAKGDYHAPIEIFTVNYDLLIETGLERVGAPFFDGFVGQLNARFRPDLVEAAAANEQRRLPAFFVRVWKLHGSTNWAFIQREGHREVVRRGSPVADGRAAAIYPSEEKYEDSRRVPFITLIDRFRRALAEPETVTLVSGFSFQDQHLNEIIFDAALQNPRSETVIFCHGAIGDSVKQQAQRTRNLTALGPTEAVIGGELRRWSAAGNVPGVWAGNQFLLVDFNHLATFLARVTDNRNA
jgi:hypothetical protein